MKFELNPENIIKIENFINDSSLYIGIDGRLNIKKDIYNKGDIRTINYNPPDEIYIIYETEDYVKITTFYKKDNEELFNKIIYKINNLCGYTKYTIPVIKKPLSDTTDYTIKYDQNKHKLSQFPREAMEAVCEVMEYGARKYEKGSWNRVDVQRYIDAAARHLYAMQDINENGKECINLAKKDEESGIEHLYHLACNVVYAVSLYRREKKKKQE